MISVEEAASWIRHGLRCPACNAEQIECTARHTSPTQWQCRTCKHRFTVKEAARDA